MRMNVKLFTLQMPLVKAKELCRNSVAKGTANAASLSS